MDITHQSSNSPFEMMLLDQQEYPILYGALHQLHSMHSLKNISVVEIRASWMSRLSEFESLLNSLSVGQLQLLIADNWENPSAEIEQIQSLFHDFFDGIDYV